MPKIITFCAVVLAFLGMPMIAHACEIHLTTDEMWEEQLPTVGGCDYVLPTELTKSEAVIQALRYPQTHILWEDNTGVAFVFIAKDCVCKGIERLHVEMFNLEDDMILTQTIAAVKTTTPVWVTRLRQGLPTAPTQLAEADSINRLPPAVPE